jgi:hypothetical protein
MSFSIWGELEKTINDIIRVEALTASVSMAALGILMTAINGFNQTNVALAQVHLITICSYVPIGPIFNFFVGIIIADVLSLSTGLVARIIGKEQAKWKHRLIIWSVVFLIASLGIFAMTVLYLGLGKVFYYPPC